MNDIKKIYDMMSCNNPIETRLEGLRRIKEIDDLSLLINPDACVSAWEYCALALYEKSDIELEPYLSELLNWIQDMNLPGAFKIMERLKSFSGIALKDAFIDSFNKALALNNDISLVRLDYLSELIDNEMLKSELSDEILKRLQKHYHNWGAWDCDC